MSYSKVLHDKAMELVDEAVKATMKGNEITARAFYKDALELEKKAIAHFSTAEEDELYKNIRIRSAAAMALRCEDFQETRHLIALSLQHNPPDFIVEQLNDIQLLIPEKAIAKLLNITGVLTYANAEINEIKIKNLDKVKSYNISVPENQLSAIVKSFWLDIVIIEATSNANGLITLETIKKAA